MAKRKSKRSRNNSEKIKRETAKRQNEQTQRNQEIIKSDSNKGNIVDIRRTELVIFRINDEEFALRVSNIKEIIRVPAIIKVPDVPQYVSGLCNLRGELLPVIDLRKLFGMPDQEVNESSRIIVADIHGKKIGFVSDKVLEVINIEETAIKEPPASIKGIEGGAISGILILNNGKRVVMILEAEKIINVGNLVEITNQQNVPVENSESSRKEEDEEEQIVTFNIGAEEYAFNICHVKEIIRMPEVMKVPNTANYIEGVFSVRNHLVAAVNPAKLLGINYKQPDENSRVVIIDNGKFSYGVIVDKVSHVVRVRKKLFKESSRIPDCVRTKFFKGIFSLNDGKRIILMLDPHKLINSEDMKGVLDVDLKKTTGDKSLHTGEADNRLEYVVFKLGEEEYGIDINNVQEINRISEITRFPGAPAFIAGMVGLRGDILPILDLRKLFTLNDSGSYSASRFLVAELGNKRIGILIDSVSGVLRFSAAYLEEAPETLKENDQDCFVDKIAKLNDGKRNVLLLNLSTLMSFM